MKKIMFGISILDFMMIALFLNQLVTYKKFDFPSFYCALGLTIGLLALQSYIRKDRKQEESK